MMPSKHPREILPGSVAAAVATVTAMGRVMLSASAGGVIHERMGPVGVVAEADGRLVLSGAMHDAVIDLGVIVRVVADRTGRMKDRALPRLELQDGEGATAFSLIGLDGLEPFDAALDRLGPGEALPARPPREAPPAPTAEALPEGVDAGARLLARVAAAGQPVSVRFRCRGLEQGWTGIIGEVKPAMGFLNVLLPDFHLHLKDDAVAVWRRDGAGDIVTLSAQAADGAGLGLVFSGPAAAFAEA